MDVSKIKLNPEIISYKVFDFKDYKNTTHKVTIAVGKGYSDCYTRIFVGVAIQNPVDEYVEVIGANKAFKNGAKSGIWIEANFKGIENLVIANAIIDNEWEFVQNNINLFIRGYNDQKRKYLEKQAKETAELLDNI